MSRKLKKMRPGLTLDSNCVQDNLPVKIVDGIYIGSVHCAFNKETLSQYGITHILNISGVPATYPNNFTYLQLTLRDKDYANLLSAIPAANVFIESCIDDGRNVLVHCKGGRSRSAAVICAFLMSTEGLGFEQAIQTVKSQRAVAEVNKGFEMQLRAFELSRCNVYQAHQILLKDHLKKTHMEHKRTGTVIIRQLASASLTAPVRLRLTRPVTSDEQVIPSLRGADMQFVCRQCKTPLFVSSSIIQTPYFPPKNPSVGVSSVNGENNALIFEGKRDHHIRPPRLRRHYASDTLAKSTALSNTLSVLEVEGGLADILSGTARATSHSLDMDTDIGNSASQKLDLLPMEIDDTGMDVDIVNEESTLEDVKLSTDYHQHCAVLPRTPPLRPQSREKHCWLSGLRALECGVERPQNRRHRPSLIARFDEQQTVLICENEHFFIEPMEWMGKLTNPNGPICCANELCKLQLGWYDWDGVTAESELEYGAGKQSEEIDDGESLKCPIGVVPAFRIEAGLVLAQEGFYVNAR